MTLVTPSYWLSNIISQSYLEKYTIKVIQNGIDLQVFYPQSSDIKEKYGFQNKKVILGVAALWIKEKGIDIFNKLASIISDEYVIVLIGEYQKENITSSENIVHINRTTDLHELAKWYSCAYCYVNASVQETMGMTTVEALACGTKVIVFNKTAVPEVVDMTVGRILNSYNEEAVLETIIDKDFSLIKQEDCVFKAEQYEKNKKYLEYLSLYENQYNEYRQGGISE